LGIQVKKVLGEKLAEVPQPDKWRLLYLECVRQCNEVAIKLGIISLSSSLSPLPVIC
jgi:hypothetical protein